MTLGCAVEASFHRGLGEYAFSLHLLEEHFYHNPGKMLFLTKMDSKWVQEKTNRITQNMLQGDFYYCPSPVEEDSTTIGYPFTKVAWYPAYREPKDPDGNKPKWR